MFKEKIFNILAKLCAIVAGLLMILGIIDKLFFPHSNILLQHENYFVGANPFILFAILFYLVYTFKKKK
ncbi:MAG: hypothetical protein KAW92_05575 [Candidatus Cloacimonetes bacterium]|nr:hypothetical protein [Candidatus Cloacimonadota bacterium]